MTVIACMLSALLHILAQNLGRTISLFSQEQRRDSLTSRTVWQMRSTGVACVAYDMYGPLDRSFVTATPDFQCSRTSCLLRRREVYDLQFT